MRESLGMVETRGISTAIEVADVMVKAANVKILELENSRGSGYMTVKVTGDVGAVKAAVSAAKAEGLKHGNVVSASVIARPSDGMASLFCNPKVPYQSVNKKPIPQAWDDERKASKAKKEPAKKVAPKAAPKPAAKAQPTAKVADKPLEAKKTAPVAEQKKEEPKKVVAKPPVETKAPAAKSAEPKKAEDQTKPPSKTEAKPKPKISSSKKRKK